MHDIHNPKSGSSLPNQNPLREHLTNRGRADFTSAALRRIALMNQGRSRR